MRWVLILAAVFVMAACGGDDDSTGDGAPTTTLDATPAGVAPTATPEGDDTQGETTAAMIVFSGAESGEITDKGSCGSGPDGEGLQLFTSLYDEQEDLTWMLQIYVREYDGPGEYEVGDSMISGGVSFSDTVVTLGRSGPDAENWGSTGDNGGTVVVNDDETSGTVDATLTVEDGSSEIQLSGTWICDAL